MDGGQDGLSIVIFTELEFEDLQIVVFDEYLLLVGVLYLEGGFGQKGSYYESH